MILVSSIKKTQLFPFLQCAQIVEHTKKRFSRNTDTKKAITINADLAEQRTRIAHFGLRNLSAQLNINNTLETQYLLIQIGFCRKTSNITPIKMFEEVTASVHDLVKAIGIETMTPDDLGNHALSINKDTLERNVMTNYHRSFGRCYTISLAPDILLRGIK